ncbi:MAG: S41 family peptidase [Chloroflexota bacterium]
MTRTASHPASGRPRASRVLTGLLLLLIGAGAGLGASLAMPRAMGAEPSPSPAASEDPTRLPAGFDVWQQALGIIRDHYVDPSAASDQAIVEGSIRGMVDALGDAGHTVYLTEEEKAVEEDVLNGTIIGIGVTVDARNGSPTIVSVLEGSPASRAGLRPGDAIIAVDGQRTDRSGTSRLVELVRGEVGTTVKLRIRAADGTQRDVSLVREKVELPTVEWAMVPGSSVAVIRLNQFSQGAGKEVADAARDALAADASAVILDLRGNPGGLLDEAVAVAGTFLPEGTVYQSVDRSGTSTPRAVRGDAVVPDLPMAVLVDYGSASSAEIVAAALQENGRARVVGEPTYGTDTILMNYDLRDGSAIRLGVERWNTPDGHDVFDTGITPDVTVALPADGSILEPPAFKDLTRKQFNASTDTQLRRAVRMLSEGSGAAAPA